MLADAKPEPRVRLGDRNQLENHSAPEPDFNAGFGVFISMDFNEVPAMPEFSLAIACELLPREGNP